MFFTVSLIVFRTAFEKNKSYNTRCPCLESLRGSVVQWSLCIFVKYTTYRFYTASFPPPNTRRDSRKITRPTTTSWSISENSRNSFLHQPRTNFIFGDSIVVRVALRARVMMSYSRHDANKSMTIIRCRQNPVLSKMAYYNTYVKVFTVLLLPFGGSPSALENSQNV